MTHFGNVDTLLVCFGPFHFIGGECGGTATELRTLFSKIGIQHSKFSQLLPFVQVLWLILHIKWRRIRSISIQHSNLHLITLW